MTQNKASFYKASFFFTMFGIKKRPSLVATCNHLPNFSKGACIWRLSLGISALSHGWKILLVANQNILIRFLGHRIDSFSPISVAIVSLLQLLNSEFIYVILNPKCSYLICISMGRRGKYAQHFIFTLFSRDALFIRY